MGHARAHLPVGLLARTQRGQHVVAEDLRGGERPHAEPLQRAQRGVAHGGWQRCQAYTARHAHAYAHAHAQREGWCS